MAKGKKKFYAVHRGHRTGVFDSWPVCEKHVKGFPGARYKGFATAAEARQFAESGVDVAAAAAPRRASAKPAQPARRVAAAPRVAPSRVDAAYYLYTDGGCVGNANVAAKRHQPAGWGVHVLDRGGAVAAELYGPVELAASASYFLGAETGSNNTGELSAIAEALMWLRDSAGPGTAVIRYDSEYAAKITQRIFAAHKNKALATTCQSLLDAVRRTRTVSFEHVKGHSGDPGNDRADELAGLGCRGQRSGRLAPRQTTIPAASTSVPRRTTSINDKKKLSRSRRAPSQPLEKNNKRQRTGAAGVIDLTEDDD